MKPPLLEEKIVVKAMCLFVRNGKTLVSKGRDEKKGEDFYRAIGGGVKFFEKGEDAVRREVREELKSEIENLKFIDVVENIFTYNGNRGHQITFLYSGDLARKELYDQPVIHIVDEGYEFDAEWVPISDILENKVPLYPKWDYTKYLK